MHVQDIMYVVCMIHFAAASYIGAEGILSKHFRSVKCICIIRWCDYSKSNCGKSSVISRCFDLLHDGDYYSLVISKKVVVAEENLGSSK